MSTQITYCTDPTELFRQYTSQDKPQPTYIELDLRSGTMLADYEGDIEGNVTSRDVRAGYVRRWAIPVLTAEAANRTMDEIAPLADRMLSDWEEKRDWQRDRVIPVLGDDAYAAEEEIEDHLGVNLGCTGSLHDNQGFGPSDLVQVWDLDGATNGDEVAMFGITADTSDERLEEIENWIAQQLAEISDESSGVIVTPGLGEYLRERRDALIEEDA